MPRHPKRDAPSLERIRYLFSALNLHRSTIRPYNPVGDDECTGLCCYATYLNKGVTTYPGYIGAIVTTQYSRGASTAVRYLSVKACRELSVIVPELWDYAHSALLSYRVLARQRRAEERDFVQIALIDLPEDEKVPTANTRGKAKPKHGDQISIFDLLPEMQCTKQ